MSIGAFTSTLGFSAQSQWAADEKRRRDAAVARETVYYHWHDELLALVQAELSRVSDVNLDTIPFQPLNICGRIISDLAMIYKKPARRRVGDVDPYEGIKSNINVQARAWDALARLHNTVLVRPFWWKDEERLEYRIYTPAHTEVKWREDDYTRPESVVYYTSRLSPSGMYESIAYEWTSTDARMITAEGEDVIDGLRDTSNPYGELPFVVLRLQDMGDFWGEGATELTQANVQFLAQWSLLLENAQQQGFSIPFGINTGLGRRVLSQSETGSNELRTVGIGPRKGIFVENVASEEATPSLTYITPQPLLDATGRLLDKSLSLVCWRYGLSMDRLAIIKSDAGLRNGQSGVAKALDNADLEEIREAALETYREFESELYRVTAMVLAKDGGPTLPDPKEFRIDFAELDVKRTFDEIKAEREFKLANGMATVPEFMVEDNPDLKLPDAQKKWRENMALNEELTLATGIRGALQPDDEPAREGEDADEGRDAETEGEGAPDRKGKGGLV